MKHSISCAIAIFLLATACDDGSGSSIGDLTAPSVVLTFPPAISFTDAESITVRGTAADRSGVAEIRVNGVFASTSDDFANWEANVPLALGWNTLTVVVSDVRGNSDTLAAQARIESQALLGRPTRIAVDPARQLALVFDGEGAALKTVDLMSGLRTTLSDHAHGIGPRFSPITSGIAFDFDRALVIDPGYPPTVIAVDLVTGDRTILSDDTHGRGPRLGNLRAIAIDGDRALVAFSEFFMAVDLASGDRTILSGPSVGSGPLSRFPEGIVVDGMRALVLDRALQALLAVDLSTGDRTVLSDASTGTGPLFSGYSLGITLDGSRVLMSDNGLAAVLAIDLLTGDRTILSSPSGAPEFSDPTGIILDEARNRALVTDQGLQAVLGVDLSSGERTLVTTRLSVGTGPPIESRGIWLEENRALIGGGREASLLAVDVATGDRTILSGPSDGIGPDFTGVRALVVDGGRALALAQHDFYPFSVGIFAVDLASGDRSIVSDSSTGAGPEFDEPYDIALAGSEILVAERKGLMAVDLANGDRRFASGFTGQGPGFDGPCALVVDGNRAIVVDSYDERSSILEVDLTSGDRAIVSDEARGQGPSFKNLNDVVLDGDRVLVGRSPGATIYAVDLATGDRTVLSDFETGAGPAFNPGQIARNGDRVWVTAPQLRGIIALDPQSGQRTIVAR